MKYIAIVLLFTVSIALLTWRISSHDQAQCDYIESLAKNPEIVSTLDRWVIENVIDRGYYLVSGMHGRIAAHRNEDADISYIPLPDKKITGIEDEYFRFSISKHDSAFNDPIASSNVHSIYIGRGRDYVIITKNGHTLSSHRGPDFKSGKLKKIGESVYAYCSDGRFRM